VNTFGFGADHDALLLKTIAEKSDGVYYYIQNAEAIPKAFANCFGKNQIELKSFLCFPF